jgi:hypothetical protein
VSEEEASEQREESSQLGVQLRRETYLCQRKFQHLEQILDVHTIQLGLQGKRGGIL